jgi:hypothetical protein
MLTRRPLTTTFKLNLQAENIGIFNRKPESTLLRYRWRRSSSTREAMAGRPCRFPSSTHVAYKLGLEDVASYVKPLTRRHNVVLRAALISAGYRVPQTSKSRTCIQLPFAD